MTDHPELQMNEEVSPYSPKRRRPGYGSSKFFQILLGALLILIFAGGIFYFLSRQSTEGGGSFSPSQVAALEQKIAGLEKQLMELQGKLNAPGTDSSLVQRLDALTLRVEAMEKQKQAMAESKTKSSAPSKPAPATKKQYHQVQKGETLLHLSKKYKIGVEELRKLNKLSPDKPLRIGQKLLVSMD